MRRADNVTLSLLNDTVLNDWFQPMLEALENVRFSDRVFRSLPMASFILFGGLRQLLSVNTLREQVQALFHFSHTEENYPVPKSTWSDAMSHSGRRDIMRQAINQLIVTAQAVLPDRLEAVEGIKLRPVIAIDATYQEESSHYHRVLPKEGGEDNQKGHMLLTYYDCRYGIPLNVRTETSSMGEMRVFKEDESHPTDWSRTKNAIYVVDRAFIDGSYWDERKTKFKATVITRLKSTLSYSSREQRELSSLVCNESVVSDVEIKLNCSKQPWRLIHWRSPEGTLYEYITNDFTLEPGVVAFLYYRRWDVEKYFDNFKHDLANAKSWGKSPIAIEQQALMGLMTFVLTQIFLQKRYKDLGLEKGDQTQNNKHEKKVATYLEYDNDESGSNHIPLAQFDAYRAFHSNLSKITRQVWRFLKYCFDSKASSKFYERQFKPLLLKYL